MPIKRKQTNELKKINQSKIIKSQTKTKPTLTKNMKNKNKKSVDDIESDNIDSDFELNSSDGEDFEFKESSIKRRKLEKNKNNDKEDELKKIKNNKSVIQSDMISKSTMDFLNHLTSPEKNDRNWLTANDDIYKLALDNWKSYIGYLSPKLIECDWTLPNLPTKDLIHRLHRDIRFSNDKTPYKKNFSAGFSRTGKKGPWASYYLHIQPNNKSLIAGGIWSPEKNELATIRNSILRNSKPIRKVINDPEFIKFFGKPIDSNKRQNIFGHDDTLKKCPKMNGVDPSHPDIDLLKLRTIAAVKNFDDEIVLSKKFETEIMKTMKVLAPLVQCINEMISPQSDNEEEEED